jgi:hypothetical protein
MEYVNKEYFFHRNKINDKRVFCDINPGYKSLLRDRN